MSFDNDPHSERDFACPANQFGITDYAELRSYGEPLATTLHAALLSTRQAAPPEGTTEA